MKKILIGIFIFNTSLLLLHLFKIPFVQIDNITILLMILVLITPFASQIKKVKWGEFEAELSNEIKKLSENVKDNVKDFEKKENEQEGISKIDTIEKELYDLAKRDKILAFAKLRIEIELRLKKLFISPNDFRQYGIRNMTQTLATTGIISNQLRNLINDITSILNRAMHGENIPTDTDVESVLDAGAAILNMLDFIFYDKVVEPSTTKKIPKKELKKYMDSKYEVTTIVPLEEKPYINKRILDQQQLDLFLDGYDEYAEFLVKIEKTTK